MARLKDLGDTLVEEILEVYYEDGKDGYDFEEWLDFKFSRKLAELITGKSRTEIKEENKEPKELRVLLENIVKAQEDIDNARPDFSNQQIVALHQALDVAKKALK